MLPLPISPPPFLDVGALLELSQPPRRINWFWYFIGVFGVLVLVGRFNSAEDPNAQKAVQVFTGLLMIMTLGAGVAFSITNVRKLRAQQQTVDAIEEMMQLRRWEPAGMLLDRFLSSPVKSVRTWASALVQLAALLARHHRFEDCISVQSFLIDHELLDDQGDYYIRLGRTMAMLREDHLVDADRAINDLRRRGPEGGSGGLALVEIFRDVKTGHPDEAIDIFNKFLPAMRQQLGHRIADAYGLIASAYDVIGDEAQAKLAYERATLLTPPAELLRRYPELVKLAEKYPAAVAPAQISPAQISPAQFSPAQFSPAQFSPAQFSPPQTSKESA